MGDDPAAVAANRQRLADDLGLVAPTGWVWLHQDHTARVVVVDRVPDVPPVADGVVTTTPGLPVAALSADCTLILLEAPGAVAAVHGGWKGLAAGIVDAAVAAMRSVGAEPTRAVLGPCARPAHYEFGEDLLERFTEQFGPSVAARTVEDTPALDLGEVVRIALDREGVSLEDSGIDTITSPDHFSHRREGETGRQALVAWMDP